jgi:anaerobic ribonucleoside-triphosphate reductase
VTSCGRPGADHQKTKRRKIIDKTTRLKALEAKRTRCTVYTRVMGYHRPVESFNIGKQGEHRQRRLFVER